MSMPLIPNLLFRCFAVPLPSRYFTFPSPPLLLLPFSTLSAPLLLPPKALKYLSYRPLHRTLLFVPIRLTSPCLISCGLTPLNLPSSFTPAIQPSLPPASPPHSPQTLQYSTKPSADLRLPFLYRYDAPISVPVSVSVPVLGAPRSSLNYLIRNGTGSSPSPLPILPIRCVPSSSW